MPKMIRRLEDWLLSVLQRRCAHPSDMVAVDITEGMIDAMEISYCRRCGAVSIGHENDGRFADTKRLMSPWRVPDPNLWRG